MCICTCIQDRDVSQFPVVEQFITCFFWARHHWTSLYSLTSRGVLLHSTSGCFSASRSPFLILRQDHRHYHCRLQHHLPVFGISIKQYTVELHECISDSMGIFWGRISAEFVWWIYGFAHGIPQILTAFLPEWYIWMVGGHPLESNLSQCFWESRVDVASLTMAGKLAKKEKSTKLGKGRWTMAVFDRA